MAADFYWTQGDLAPVLNRVLYDSDGVVVPLLDATVTFRMEDAAGNVVIDDASADIIDEDGGEVEYEPVDGDTDNPGMYSGSFRVTYLSGDPQTFPSPTRIRIQITPR